MSDTCSRCEGSRPAGWEFCEQCLREVQPPKIRIDTSDPDTKAVWDAAVAAREEVAGWAPPAKLQRLLGLLLDMIVRQTPVSASDWEEACLHGGRYCEPWLDDPRTATGQPKEPTPPPVPAPVDVEAVVRRFHHLPCKLCRPGPGQLCARALDIRAAVQFVLAARSAPVDARYAGFTEAAEECERQAVRLERERPAAVGADEGSK